MKKIYFSGSFDLFHSGHLESIKEAKKIADREGGILVVGVNTDELYLDYKGKAPVIPYSDRKKVVEAIRYVDMVVPQETFETLPSLKKYNIDVYVMCKDWEKVKEKEIKYMEASGGKCEVLPYFKVGMPSSDIKKKLTKVDLKAISKIVESWNIKYLPEYRPYKCGSCLKDIDKAWHIWFDDDGFKCEIHLCKECGKKFNLI